MTAFPTALDEFENPQPNDPTNSPTVPHAAQHANANDAIEALEAKVGVDDSDDPSSLDYLVRKNTAVSVLEWDGSVGSISHGEMWEAGVALSPVFFWEAWVCYLGPSTGYWISEGHGGLHALLAGWTGAVPGGNIYTGAVTVSFTGDYTMQVGEWAHYAVAGDGTNAYVFINGVVVWVGALTTRQAQYGPCLIGGSDHNNFLGRIAMIRAWEGRLPHFAQNLWVGFGAERHFADTGSAWGQIACQVAADYTLPGETFPDLSSGYRGQMHPGRQYKGQGVVASQLYTGGVVNPRRVIDPTAPFGNQFYVPRVRVPAAPAAVPAGARLYDSFGREDTVPTWKSWAEVQLGSSEGGSEGAKAWSHAANTYAVFDGALVCFAYYQFARLAQTSSADFDVRGGRVTASGRNYIGLAWRIKADRSSGYVARLFNNDVVIARPDGSTVATWTPATTTWTHLRVTHNATTNAIQAYVGSSITGPWTSIGSTTDVSPANAAETGVGEYHYFAAGVTSRLTEFGAF